jgi:hypothetical protein
MNMQCIHIAYKVMGAFDNRPGDTMLAYTNEITAATGQLCMISAIGAPADHASLYLIPIEDNGRLYIAHVQGAHNVFDQGVRCYTTRAVYECLLDESDKIGGYLPIVNVLDRMRRYDSLQHGADKTRLVHKTTCRAR